ncbi:MAG: hypothetical protein AAFS10_22630 [Myxococcota bacterium]
MSKYHLSVLVALCAIILLASGCADSEDSGSDGVQLQELNGLGDPPAPNQGFGLGRGGGLGNDLGAPPNTPSPGSAGGGGGGGGTPSSNGGGTPSSNGGGTPASNGGGTPASNGGGTPASNGPSSGDCSEACENLVACDTSGQITQSVCETQLCSQATSSQLSCIVDAGSNCDTVIQCIQ